MRSINIRDNKTEFNGQQSMSLPSSIIFGTTTTDSKVQWCQTVTFKSVQCHWGKSYIFNFWHSGTLALSPEYQSAQMSEIKNVCQWHSVTSWHLCPLKGWNLVILSLFSSAVVVNSVKFQQVVYKVSCSQTFGTQVWTKLTKMPPVAVYAALF